MRSVVGAYNVKRKNAHSGGGGARRTEDVQSSLVDKEPVYPLFVLYAVTKIWQISACTYWKSNF